MLNVNVNAANCLFYSNIHSKRTFNKHDSLWCVLHNLKWRRIAYTGLTGVQGCHIHSHTNQDETGTVIQINTEFGRELSIWAFFTFEDGCIIYVDLNGDDLITVFKQSEVHFWCTEFGAGHFNGTVQCHALDQWEFACSTKEYKYSNIAPSFRPTSFNCF